jgi:MFS family permease
MKKGIIQNEKRSPEKIWNGAFVRLFIANIMLNLGQQMVNSLVAKYANFLGAKSVVVGIVSSLFAVTALFAKVISGPAIDAFNRKHILLGAAAIEAVSFFGYGISHSIPLLMIFRLLQGLGKAFTAVCCLAMAADTLPAHKFSSGISIYSLTQVICQAFGPAIGLALAKTFGYSTAFFIGGLIGLLAIFPVMQLKTARKTKEMEFAVSISRIVAKEAVRSSIIMFLLTTAFAATNSFLIIVAAWQGVENIGYFFTVYAVIMLFTRPVVGKLTDKYGLVALIIPAMGMFIISYFIISTAHTLSLYLLAALIAGFGYGVCHPLIQTLCMKSVIPECRGAASSTNYIANDLGNLVGPVLAGMMADAYGYIFMWRIMTVPIFLAIVITICSRQIITRVEKQFQKEAGK